MMPFGKLAGARQFGRSSLQAASAFTKMTMIRQSSASSASLFTLAAARQRLSVGARTSNVFRQHQSHPRFYSSSSSSSSAPKNPRGPEGPKFRYLVGIVVISSVVFYAASRSLEKKAPAQFTEEDYQAHKKKMRVMHKKSAFTPDEAAVVFVLGGPGAGKGTQCANLVRDYGFIHLSAGDLLREEQAREGSEYGEMIATYIREGKIVPQEVTIALLRNAMKHNIVAKLEKEGGLALDEPCRFLIDGFPRQMDQALKFEEDVAVSRFTLFFECPEEIMLKRLLKRGETSGRTDDNVESIKKRFRTFIEASMPVVQYFDKAGKVVKIHCNQPVDQVYRQVKLVLEDRMGI